MLETITITKVMKPRAKSNIANFSARVTDPVVSLDINGRFTFVNDKAGEFFKTTPQKLLGKNIEAVFPEDISPLLPACHESIAKQIPSSVEKYYPQMKRWFEHRLYPSLDGLSIHFFDITQRKLTEEKLQNSLAALRKKSAELEKTTENQQELTQRLGASNKRHRAFITNTVEGMWCFEFEKPIPLDLPEEEQVELLYKYGYLAEMNDTLAASFGYASAKVMIGARIEDLAPRFKPTSIPQLLEIARSGYKVKEWQATGVDRYGNERIRLNTMIPTIENNHLIRVWGTARDITEQIRSERQFRNLLEAAPDAMVIAERDGKIVFANQYAETLFGYSKEELLELALEELVSSRFRDNQMEFAKMARKNCEQNLTRHEFELYGLRKDDSEFPIDISLSQLETEQGLLITAAIKDVTEQKQERDELQQSKEQLRNLSNHLQTLIEEERKDIAREIHDDFGQMLSALKIDVSWLSKKLKTNQSTLQHKVDSMLKLLDSAITSVYNIATKLRPPLLDDLGLITALEWLTEDFHKRTGIKYQIRAEPKTMNLEQDVATALFRIYQEAIANVMRHAKATNLKVSLKQSTGKIELVVQDNGKGISENDTPTPKSYGLIGIQERVYNLGGQFTVRGIKGKGTTLKVIIPLAKRRQEA